jgi:hypothetical protein
MKPKEQNSGTDDHSARSPNQQSLINGPISVVCLPPALSDQERAEKKKKERRETIKFRTEIVGVVMVFGYLFFTILIWCANKKVAEDTHQSVVNADNNFRLDQRPWLGVLEMDTTVPSRESMKVKMEFINSGKTPALKEHLAWQADCDPVRQKPTIKYTEDIKDQGAIIMPNQHFWAASEPSALCSEKNFALLKEGKAALTVLGTIWYRDEFSTPHSTDFCLYLLMPKSEAKKQPTEDKYVDPQVCDYHNSAN